MIDRSGRTYEEYRQLYWDERKRRKAAEIEVDNFKSDAYVLSLLTKLDEQEKQLETVRLLHEKWLSKDRYDHYDTSRESKTMTKCANELQAAIGEDSITG